MTSENDEKYLGEYECETKGHSIHEFVSIAPIQYNMCGYLKEMCGRKKIEKRQTLITDYLSCSYCEKKKK